MIVPRYRLLAVAAAVLTPPALGAAAAPGFQLLFLAALLALAAAACFDAWRGLPRLAALRVEIPGTMRLTKRRPAQLELTVHPGLPGPGAARVALDFPDEITPEHEAVPIALEPGAGVQRVPWELTPRARGEFTLNTAYIELRSPWGLWDLRREQPVHCKLFVYPDLGPDRKRLASIFLNRGNLGIHAQRRVGKGRDFEQLRDYIPGDGFEDIHWKATARRHHPVTKVYQVERTQEVYAVLDHSRLSARRAGDTGELEIERYIAAALVLGLVAEKQGDRFGLIAFDDRVSRFVRAHNGLPHYHAVRDAVYALRAREVNPDYAEAAAFIRTRLRKRALLVFLTNLDDPVLAEQFAQGIDIINREHLILVNMMLPADVRPLFSGPPPEDADAIYHGLGGHLRWSGLRELQRGLGCRGVTMRLLRDANFCPEIVGQYINVKQRQLL